MNLTSYVQDRQLTIALRGEIDHHAAREIMQALSAKIDLYLPLRCILDFRDVTFMDSSGIAVVIHTLRRMNTLQGRLLLQNIPPQPYKVLRAAGINHLIAVDGSASRLEMAKRELEQLKLEQAALDAASEEDAEEEDED